MGRLYPPVIESTLPACYEENGMVKITIPFSMNRSVSISQVGGFELKIKTVQTGTYLHTVQTVNPVDYEINETESYVNFYFKNDNKMKVGQFYKVQLAYIENNIDFSNKYNEYLSGKISLEELQLYVQENVVIGFYSPVGIIKYTTKPKLYINNFLENHLNDYTYNYTGYYEQINGDNSEKVYSYQFDIYDNKNQLIISSGEKIHNSNLDTNIDMSIDNFSVMLDLQYYTMYYIQYTVTTINKLKISSPKYRMIQRETIDPELYADLNVTLNFDNGYIDLSLNAHKDDFIERAIQLMNSESTTKWMEEESTIIKKGFSAAQAEIIYRNRYNLSAVMGIIYHKSSGSFILSRASEDSTFSNWEELYRFKLYDEIPKGILFRDYTIEQGKKYQYSIQQYNDQNLFSKRIYSNIIVADFEDAFLFDGERQLKIKYNPKMTKFTNTVLEAKQDTIGGKYPFIFRNGVVNYHEFPLGGLISYFMDEEQLFLREEEFDIAEKTINYTTDNLAQERLFKMKVLEWLNNGKPKLFRSPTEGNFIIRLMKVSLSPENKLGRLLHNFSCTAYEIAEYNYKNLQYLNILPNMDEKFIQLLKYKSINLEEIQPGQIINQISNNLININSLQIEGMNFGESLLINYQDGSQETIKIGITGNYYFNNLMPISAISIIPRYKNIGKVSKEIYDKKEIIYYELKDNKYIPSEEYDSAQIYYMLINFPLKGLLTYSYYEMQGNSFSEVMNVSYDNPSYKQFIGEHNILKEILQIDDHNINLKKELTEWYYIRAEKRPIDKIVTNFPDLETNIDSMTDTGEYYYGVEGHHTERMPLVELLHPVGMRVYEPGIYYIQNDFGAMVKENKYSKYKEGQTYYLKGQYERIIKTIDPVGTTVFNPDEMYKLSYNAEGEPIYELANKYSASDARAGYYTLSYDIWENPVYTRVDNVCSTERMLYKQDKFYRIARQFYNEDGQEQILYSYSSSPNFNPDMDYYILDESKPGFVEAYVTINENYKYNTTDYYIHIINKDTLDDRYERVTSTDYNTYNSQIEDYEYIEYDVNEVLKYYKMKTILPHILHLVGTEWKENYEKNNLIPDTYYENKNYNFMPKKYKDFYNNKEYKLNEYAPWLEINGKKIYIDDTVFYSIDNLKDVKIESLSCGNGVIVEVGYQLKNLDYIIENNLESKVMYNYLLNNLQYELEKLNFSSGGYIDLSYTHAQNYDNYYSNKYHNSIKQAYDSLIRDLNQKIGSGGKE